MNHRAGQTLLFSRTIGAILLASAMPLSGADLQLQPETLAAWNQYVEAAKCKMKARLKPGAQFLWMDEDQQRSARVRKGDIVVGPVDKQNNPLGVSSGLIHHWIGAAFVPNSSIADVFAVVNDYQKYKDIYTPSVVDSKSVSRNETEGRFKLMLQSKSHFVKTAFDGDYVSHDVQVDPKRWYSFSTTTNIQEIEHFRQANEKKLPAGQGSGVIWRLFSVNRFEERDGGVYVELEALLLSREIPNGLHWLVDPIVRRVGRSSLTTSLQQTGAAVRTQVAMRLTKPDASHRASAADPDAAVALEAKGGQRSGSKPGQK